MRTATLLLILSAIASAAGAQMLQGVRVDPAEVTVGVGETVTIQAHGIVGCCSSFPWHVAFGTGNRDVAEARGFLESPHWTANITVTGRGPGSTYVQSPAIGHGDFPLATIHVVCREERAPAAVAPVVATVPGRPVQLAVAIENLAGKALTWYCGRYPDVSRVLDGVGPEIAFTPEEAGTHYVSVLIAGACATSVIEFRVEAVSPRRRAMH